jgi:serine/threonine-protein kinase
MTAAAVVNTQGLVGQIIGDGRYDLRELLGGGSMGYVYRAFDRRLETDVVVKIPRRHKLENPHSLRRFRQESKFLVKLTHPRVVSILDIGEYDDVPFFVMPFISGGCLRSRQRNELGEQQPLKPASLRSWLLEIAKALDFIHAQSCVHRDVKPDNILFDEHGHPFLSDFGLSKIVRADEKDDPSQTAAGAIVGTPLFTAPELVLGEAIDGRSDQYSLALTVYDTLAGSNPFLGPTTTATLVNQTSLDPPPLTLRNPSVSDELWRVVLKGLSKSPEDRFASCVAFAEAVLARISNGASQSSASHASPKNAGRRSSAANSVTDTAVSARSMGRAPVEASGPKMKYVVSARASIVKAKSTCPGCSANLALMPAFAGKKATCQKCQSRLLIAPDFSEVRKLELVPLNRSESGNGSKDSGTSSAGEFELVLGKKMFGWKLTRQWALRLAGLLILLLVLLTIFFTNKSSQAERERLREQYRPRSMERP